LIRLISSLAYANVAELGYDPTMELCWKRDKWNYKITIKGENNRGKIVTKVYETTDIIADMSSNLRERATRVYEAYDVENPNTKVVIKDSWVDSNRPKEADTLSEILDDASDDEKAMFWTVLIHGVVQIDGREDLTQDLLMNGYLISTDDDFQDDSINETENFDNVIDELQERMANVDITKRRAEDTARVDHIYRASIFEILKALNPASQWTSLVTTPNVSTSNQMKRPPRVYGSKAHYRMVFKERGESLHSMSRRRQIKLPLVVQAMYDILKGSMVLSNISDQ
jgi:Fungal protein kinase